MSTTQPIRNSVKLQEFKSYYFTEKPNYRNYTLCIIGLNTALRITDILHLRWEDVLDFSTGSCYTHVSVTEKKTGKLNTIALNHCVTEVLLAYYSMHSKAPSAQDFLFQSRNGNNRPLSRCQAFRIVKEAANATGLGQHISCHSLRKTFGYHAWQQGISPALLMDIYNHSSYRITKRYLGIEQDDRDNVFLNISL